MERREDGVHAFHRDAGPDYRWEMFEPVCNGQVAYARSLSSFTSKVPEFAGRQVVILQIDAHIDWRDEVGGEHWGLSSNMRRASEMAHVTGIVQVGQRGIGSARPVP